MEFMYDVSTCTARIIGNRLDENGISLADWPHTNPIWAEQDWAKLKEHICMLYPNHESFNEIRNQLKEIFYKANEEAWGSLGDDYFDPLMKSMEICVDAVLGTNGWYTRY